MTNASIRILVGNEPRSYRDAVADALRVLRPDVEIIVADADRLDDELIRHEPHVVLCSRITESVMAHADAWVLLYPNGAGLVITCIGGQQTIAGDLDLDHLLAVVDQIANAAATATNASAV